MITSLKFSGQTGNGKALNYLKTLLINLESIRIKPLS